MMPLKTGLKANLKLILKAPKEVSLYKKSYKTAKSIADFMLSSYSISCLKPNFDGPPRGSFRSAPFPEYCDNWQSLS